MVFSRLRKSQTTILPSPAEVEILLALALSPFWIWMQEIWKIDIFVNITTTLFLDNSRESNFLYDLSFLRKKNSTCTWKPFLSFWWKIAIKIPHKIYDLSFPGKKLCRVYFCQNRKIESFLDWNWICFAFLLTSHNFTKKIRQNKSCDGNCPL